MKTRHHQAAINKEQVTPGTSCAKKSTALTSTKGQGLGGKLNLQQNGTSFRYEGSRERKKLKAVEMAKMKEELPEEAEKYREKERVKEDGIEKLNKPMKRKIKTLKQQMKRQTKKELANTMNSSTDSPCSSSTPSEPERCMLARPSGCTCH